MEKEFDISKLTPEQRQAVISDHHSRGGKKGGATMKKRGRAYFQEIGRKGAVKRWDAYREARDKETKNGET